MVWLEVGGGGLAVVGVGLYLRRQLQGYWFDRRCPCPDVDLTGRVALVTGGSVGGLGYAAAESLLRLGATVVITLRSEVKAQEAVTKLQMVTPGKVDFLLVDFLSQRSVREGAELFRKKYDRLDMLILNAGVGGDVGSEVVWQTNHVSHFILTEELRPLIEATAKKHSGARVVAVSSGAHTSGAIDYASPYHPEKSCYAQSKLAQIMHLREFQRQLREQGLEEAQVKCFAVTPGFVVTNIGPLKNTWIRVLAAPLLACFGRSSWMGAQVIKMACISPDLPGGAYLSNCCHKPSKGEDDASNRPEEWRKLWELSERCAQEAKFP